LREVGFSIANGTEYPESGVAGLDPIMHYLLAGADRGYRPHLLFDPAWYMKARGTRQRDQNPLIDYISYGAREGIHPSPYFATAFYRKAAGGTGGLTPLGHFVAYGLPRGVAPIQETARGFDARRRARCARRAGSNRHQTLDFRWRAMRGAGRLVEPCPNRFRI
jgi:hypothetical protein